MWRRDEAFVRCHDSSYGATEFNPRRDISQRFRPFTSQGRTVPTLYGSSDLIGALSETLFHFVPADGEARRLRQSHLLKWLASTLAPRRDLKLVDLRDVTLSTLGLGLTREALIDSSAHVYPASAQWASAFFHSRAKPDGLVWNSRQYRPAEAFILFARGRVARSDLAIVQPPMPLYGGPGFDRVLEAAESVGITIVT
jgi:hypothetical protein